MEIELTSARPDGTWTWRAAGALKPRGSLDASLLYQGAKVGDVVRAETESGIDGITVTAIEPPRPPAAEDDSRIELLERPVAASVTTQLAGRGRRDDRAGRERPSRTRPAGRPPATAPPGQGATGQRAPAGPAARGGTARGEGDDRQAKGEAGRRPRGQGQGGTAEVHAGRGAGSDGRTRAWPRREGRGDVRHDGAEARGQGAERREVGPQQRQRRLSPANTHRSAMLESLPPEQRPIAQQLLRGGIPAVRTALFFERERAREEGRPEPSAEGVLAIAEALVTKVKAAEWRDRAEAALASGSALATRDLRALVNGSDVARDEASRDLVVSIREMLEQRVEANRQSWSDEVARHLDEGQVTRALKLSARPPDPMARFSAELAVRLRDAASSALSPELSPERWLALLTAVSESPVRRTVKPQGLPAEAPPSLLEAARQQCGRVPALAPLLGISVPPPPGPVRSNVPVRAHGRRPPRSPRPVRRTPPPAPGEPRATSLAEAKEPERVAPVDEQQVDEQQVDEQLVGGQPTGDQPVREPQVGEPQVGEPQVGDLATPAHEEDRPVLDGARASQSS